MISETFPKAKVKYEEKYQNWEHDCLLLFEFLSGNLGKEVPSESVDEIWHWMILYTERYGDFCQKHFGKFVHHIPNDSYCQNSCTCSGCNSGGMGCGKCGYLCNS